MFEETTTLSQLPNRINRFLEKKHIQDTLKSVNIRKKILNIEIYEQALTDISYKKSNSSLSADKNTVPFKENTNEKMSFLGICIYRNIIGNYLYIRYPKQKADFLHSLLNKLSDKEVPSTLLKVLKLDDYMLISREVENNYGRRDKRLLSNCFYSLIAAINMEMGEKYSKSFILNLIEKNIDIGELIRQKK